MAKSKAHEELIETVVDYKRGLRNLKTGIRRTGSDLWADTRRSRRILKSNETKQCHPDPWVFERTRTLA